MKRSEKQDEQLQQQAAQAHEAEVGGPADVQPTVRKNFADTAFWAANLLTGADGISEVELTMPQSLTTWKARVWTMAAGTRVGEESRKSSLTRI